MKYIRLFAPAILLIGFLIGCNTFRREKQLFRDPARGTAVNSAQNAGAQKGSAPFHAVYNSRSSATTIPAGVLRDFLAHREKTSAASPVNNKPASVSSSGDPVAKSSPKKKLYKAALKKATGDGDDTGLAIGLIILFILLGALIIVGIIALFAYSINSSSNGNGNGSSGSGSNSNSGGSSGNGNGSSSGCYVATMVYGSYDAPEVIVLRRFRDETLSHYAAGRAFIRWYYAWSPGFVKKYNHLQWLHRMIRGVLDRFVKFLSR